MDAGAAGQPLFDIVGVLWAESGLIQIWDGFRETLGHRQLELEQNPRLLESKVTQLWALVVVVRDQLDVEFYDRFEKLKCNANLFVLRAWLQEWDVHQGTGLSVEDMAERAFEHSERVHKARKVSSKHNTVLRRVVREFSLEAYKLQQSGTPWFHCPQIFSKTLISEFERRGVI